VRVADDLCLRLRLRDELQLGYAHLRFLSIWCVLFGLKDKGLGKRANASLARFFMSVNLCLYRSSLGRERLSSRTLGGDHEVKSGGGEVLTSKVISARLAVAVAVPFATADEEINDVFGARFAVGDAVLPVEGCSLHKQPSGLCARDGFGELFDGAKFDHVCLLKIEIAEHTNTVLLKFVPFVIRQLEVEDSGGY